MSNTIKVSGGFSVGNSEPVDDRTLVANITARDAIVTGKQIGRAHV